MARRGIKGQAQSEEEDVNVTPLLDIVFIMLIFFIVTSTFIKEPGVDIIRPLVETQEEQKPAVLVAITSDDRIFVNKDEVELAELRFEVQKLRKETPKGNAVVQADRGSKSKTLIDVLQQIKDAGIDDVAVSTLEG